MVTVKSPPASTQLNAVLLSAEIKHRFEFKILNSGGGIAGHELVGLHHAIGTKDNDEVL